MANLSDYLPTASASPWKTVDDGIAYDDGKVGIGIDPVHRLTVGDSSENARWSARPYGEQVIIYSYRTDTNTYAELNHRAYSYSFNIGTGSDGRNLVLNHSGNLGIGTDAPVRPLQIGDNTGSEEISIQSGTTSEGSLYFGDNTATSAEYAGMLRYNHNDDSMQLWTTSTERMRIDDTGNVGIGTKNPSQLLHVLDAAGRAEVRVQAVGGGNGAALALLGRDGSNVNTTWTMESVNSNFTITGDATERLRIDTNGRVDITGSLYVNGTPKIGYSELITTLVTLRKATMDDTQDIRESLRDAIDELVEGFEQEIATMPALEE